MDAKREEKEIKERERDKSTKGWRRGISEQTFPLKGPFHSQVKDNIEGLLGIVLVFLSITVSRHRRGNSDINKSIQCQTRHQWELGALNWH